MSTLEQEMGMAVVRSQRPFWTETLVEAEWVDVYDKGGVGKVADRPLTPKIITKIENDVETKYVIIVPGRVNDEEVTLNNKSIDSDPPPMLGLPSTSTMYLLKSTVDYGNNGRVEKHEIETMSYGSEIPEPTLTPTQFVARKPIGLILITQTEDGSEAKVDYRLYDGGNLNVSDFGLGIFYWR